MYRFVVYGHVCEVGYETLAEVQKAVADLELPSYLIVKVVEEVKAVNGKRC